MNNKKSIGNHRRQRRKENFSWVMLELAAREWCSPPPPPGGGHLVTVPPPPPGWGWTVAPEGGGGGGGWTRGGDGTAVREMARVGPMLAVRGGSGASRKHRHCPAASRN